MQSGVKHLLSVGDPAATATDALARLRAQEMPLRIQDDGCAELLIRAPISEWTIIDKVAMRRILAALGYTVETHLSADDAAGCVMTIRKETQ